jgi:hypothetical protein
VQQENRMHHLSKKHSILVQIIKLLILCVKNVNLDRGVVRMHLNSAACHYILVQKIDGQCRRIGTEAVLSDRIDSRDGQVRKV